MKNMYTFVQAENIYFTFVEQVSTYIGESILKILISKEDFSDIK